MKHTHQTQNKNNLHVCVHAGAYLMQDGKNLLRAWAYAFIFMSHFEITGPMSLFFCGRMYNLQYIVNFIEVVCIFIFCSHGGYLF